MNHPDPALLDTSVWVCYLRPRGHEHLKSQLRTVLSEGGVYTCWPVKAELLVGARDDEGYARLLELLRALPQVPISEEVWEGASRLGHTMRRRGVLIPLPDLLIAQATIESALTLWHLDDHFEQIESFSSLRTRSFLGENP